MKFPSPVSIEWLAALINAKPVGNLNASVTGINEIHTVQSGDVVFVDHPKYYDACIHSPASCIIINAETDFPADKVLLITPEPFEAYLTIVEHFRPFTPASKPVSDTASVGEGTQLFPGVTIGHHTSIGSNCIIYPNVTILDHCVIGNNVVIHPGAVIGSDAFYYNSKKNRDVWYKKMKSCGRVIVEDDVEIGSNTTIDRGVTNDTLIGRGTKIDNLVHVGHDTTIGPNCLIAAQVGIAGGVVIGTGVTLWGQVGVSKTLTIGDHATVLAQSGVPSSLKGNAIYFGTPADDAMVTKKQLVWIRRIPEIWKKVMQ